MSINLTKLRKDFFNLFFKEDLYNMNILRFCNLLDISESYYHKKICSKESIIVDSFNEYLDKLKIARNYPKQIMSDYNYEIFKTITKHDLTDMFFQNLDNYLMVFKDCYLSYFAKVLKDAVIFDYSGKILNARFFILNNFDLLKNSLYLKSDEFLHN